jgi:hypothetical protein
VDVLVDEARASMTPYINKELHTVVTYQLPVPCGDCSVHLLIDKSGETCSAFIMDGGRDAQRLEACQVVICGLKTIALIHNITDPFLRAWVVTHWDKDHYDGVLDLFKCKLLGDFVQADDFWLYCVTGTTYKRAYEAMVSSAPHSLEYLLTYGVPENQYDQTHRQNWY